MFNQILVNIKSYDIYRTHKIPVLKKFDQFFDMNDKRKSFIFCDSSTRSSKTTQMLETVEINCSSHLEGILFEQVFYIFFSDAVFITNKLSFSVYFNQSREFILRKLITFQTLCLQLYICHFYYLCEMIVEVEQQLNTEVEQQLNSMKR